MGALGQLGLLLWKYLLLRKRQPVVLCLEIIWPVIIFLIVALVRRESPPYGQNQCHYAPRQMPSAGGFDFLQSYICNLENKCYPNEKDAQPKKNPNIESLKQSLSPLVRDVNGSTEALKDLPKLADVIKQMAKAFNRTEIKKLLDMEFKIKNFLQDPDEMKRYLVEETQFLSAETADALLNATLNVGKIYDLLGDMNIKDIVCNPALLKQYFIFPSSANVPLISESLCNINKSRIPEITRKIQNQLDVAKIFNIVSLIEDTMGNYEEAEALQDIEKMVELLQNLDEIEGLEDFIKLMTGNQDLLKWTTKFAFFMKKMFDPENSDGAPNIMMLTKYIGDLEPFIKMWMGNTTVYTGLNQYLGIFSKLSHWFQGTQKRISDVKVTLGDLFSEKSNVQQMLAEIAKLPPKVIKNIMTLEVNQTKLEQMLEELSKTGDVYTLYCVDPGYMSLFVQNNISDYETLYKIQEAICRNVNDSRKLKEEADQIINYSSLINIFVDQNEKQSQNFNWSTIIGQAVDLVNIYNSSASQTTAIIKTLRNMNFTDLYQNLGKNIGQSMNMYNKNSANTTLLETLSSMEEMYINSLKGVQPALEMHPQWLVIREQMITLSLSVDLMNEFLLSADDAQDQLVELISKDERFGSILHGLVKLGPQTTARVIEGLLDVKLVRMAIEEPVLLQEKLCNETELIAILKLPEDTPNITEIHNLLCTGNVTMMIQNMFTKIDYQEFSAKVSTFFQSINKPHGPEYDDHADLAKLYTKWMKNVNLAYQLYDTKDIVSAVNSSLPTVGWSPEQIEQFSTQLQGAVTYNVISNAIKEFGEMFEKSDLWNDYGRAVYIMEVVMESTLDQLQATQVMYSNTSTLGQMMWYSNEYGADLIEAFNNAMKDPAKRSKLLGTNNIMKVLCDAKQIRTILEVPPRVPLTEIQEFACKIDMEKLAQELSTMYQQRGYEQIEAMTQADYKLPNKTFNWKNLVDTGAKIYTTMTKVYSGVQYSQYSNVDWNNLQTPVMEMMKTFRNISIEEWMKAGMLQADMLDSLDNALENITYWRMAKEYIYMLDQVMSMTNEAMENSKDGIRLKEIFKNSPEVEQMVKLTLEASHEVMQTLENALLYPEKMIKIMMETNFEDKSFCNGISINDIMSFEDKSKVSELEDMLCKINSTYLMTMLQKEPFMQQYNNMMQKFMVMNMTSPIENRKINWTSTMNNVDTTMKNMVRLYQQEVKINTVSLLDVPGFNTTQMKEQWAGMMDTMINMSPQQYLSVYSLGDPMMKLLQDLAWKNDLTGQLFEEQIANLYKANAIMEFANYHLLKMNGSVVDLKEWIQSKEAHKVLDAIAESPDLVQTVFELVTEMAFYQNSSNVKWEQVSEKVCEDQAEFDKYFKTYGSQLDFNKIKTLVCDLNINITILLQELPGSVEGMDKLLNELSVKVTDISQLNITTLIMNFETYTRMTTYKMPQFVIGSQTAWMNETRWKTDAFSFAKSLMNYQPTDLAKGIGSLNSLFVSLQEMMPNIPGAEEHWKTTVNSLYQTQLYLEYMVHHLKAINGTKLDIVSYMNSEELTKVWTAFQNTPGGSDVLYNTIISLLMDPQKAMLLTAMNESVCTDLNLFKQLFSPPTSSNLDMAQMQKIFCNVMLNFTKLQQELIQGLRLEKYIKSMEEPVTDIRKVDFASIAANMQILVELSSYRIPALDYEGDWLDQQKWNSTLNSYWQDLNKQISQQQRDQWLQMARMLPSILSNVPITDPTTSLMLNSTVSFMHKMQTMLSFLNIHLRKMNGTDIDLMEYINSTEANKILKILPKSPDLLKVFMTTTEYASRTRGYAEQWGNVDESLCTDLTKFQMLIKSPADVDISTIQSELCALNLNGTKLLNQLTENLEGLQEVVNSFLVEETDLSKIDLNKLVSTYDELMQIIRISPPRIHIGSDDAWMQPSTWPTVLQEYILLWQYKNPWESLQTIGLEDLALMIQQAIHNTSMEPHWPDVVTTIYRMDAALEFTLNNLIMLNGSDVNLLTYINSTELWKAWQALEQSPDAADVLFSTMLQLMVNPQKAEQLTMLDDTLCTNMTKFKELFVQPSEVKTDIATIQKTICSLNLNFTLLQTQLINSVSGTEQFVHKLNERVTDIRKIDFKGLMKRLEQYSKLISYQIPQVSNSLPDWADVNLWNNTLLRHNNQLMNQLQSADREMWTQLASVLPALLSNLSSSDPVFKQILLETVSYLQRSKAMLDFLNYHLKNMNGSDVDLMEYIKSPEMSKILRIIPKSPDIVKVIMSTVEYASKNPAYADEWQSVNETICSDINEFNKLIKGPADVDMRSVQKTVCDLNLNATRLLYELTTSLEGMDKLVQAYTTQWSDLRSVDIPGLVKANEEFMKLVTLRPPRLSIGPESSWMQQANWTSTWTQFVQTWQNRDPWQSIQVPGMNDLAALFQQMIKNTPIQAQWPDIVSSIYKMEAALDFVLNNLKMFNGTSVDLLKYINSTELWKAWQALEQSPEAADVLLNTFTQLMVNPEKASKLAMLDDKICSNQTVFSEIFVSPPHVQIDVAMLQKTMCSLNLSFTDIQGQMIENVPGLGTFLQKLNTNVTDVSKIDFVRILQKIEEYSKLLSFQLPQITNTVPQWADGARWNTTWNAYLEQLMAQLDLQQRQANLFGDMMAQLAPLLQNPGANITLDESTTMQLVILEVLFDYFRLFEKINTDLPGLVSKYPSLEKLTWILQNSPDIWETVVLTLLDQKKSGYLNMILSTNPGYMCNGSDWRDIMVQKAGSPLDLKELQRRVCLLQENEDQIMTDFNQFYMRELFSVIEPLLSPNKPKTFNVTQLVADMTYVTNLLANDSGQAWWNRTQPSWPWLDQRVWMSKADNIVQSLPKDPMAFTNDLSTYMKQLEDSLKVIPESNMGNKIWSIFADVFISKLEMMVNETSFDLRDLFPNSPEMTKLLTIILDDPPTVLEYFLTLTDSSQFQTFIEDIATNATRTLSNICIDGGKKYLLTPDASNSNLMKLQNRFCQLDIPSLVAEADKEFNISTIQDVLSKRTQTSWTDLTVKNMRLIELVNWLSMKPPKIQLKGHWINQTVWIQVLERYGQQQNTNVFGTYMSMLENLQTVLPVEFYTVYNEMVKWLLEQMDTLPEGNISLSDFLSSGRLLQEWFNNGTRITPEVVDIILNAWMKNPSEIIALFTANDTYHRLCNTSHPEYKNIFNIQTEDVRNFYNSLCTMNSSELYNEVQQLLSIAPTIMKIQKQNLTQFNVTEFRINSMRLEKKLQEFMSNLPAFTLPQIDEARLTRLLQDFYSQYAQFDPNMLNQILEGILSGVAPSMEQLPPTVTTYFKTFKIFQDYFNVIFEQIRPKAGTVDLGNLIQNTTKLGNILQSMEGLGPELAQDLASISVHVDKLWELFNLKPEELESVLCSADKLERYFIFPAKYNTEELARRFCGTIGPEFIEEIREQLRIDWLLDQMITLQSSRTLNMTDFMTGYKQLIENLMELSGVTDARFWGRSFSSIFNMTMELPPSATLPAILQTLQDPLLAEKFLSDPQSFGEMMEKVTEGMKGSPFWDNYIRMLEIQNHIINVFNERIQLLPSTNLTINDLLRAEPELRSLIERSLKLAPELVAAFLEARVNFSQVMSAVKNTDWQDFLCGGTVEYPVNREAIMAALCSTNVTMLNTELENLIDYKKIMELFVDKITTNQAYNGSVYNVTVELEMKTFNWTEYLINSRTYSQQLERLMTSSNFTGFDEFMNLGNASYWLEKLQKIFVSPTDVTDYTISMLGEWMNQQNTAMQHVLSSLPIDNKSIYDIVKSVAVAADAIAGRINSTSGDKVTVGSLFKDEPAVRKLLTDSFKYSPELVAALITARVNPAKFMGPSLQPAFCGDGIVYPPHINETIVKQLLCNTNITVLETELKKMINYDTIIKAISPNTSANTGPIDWTKFFYDLKYISEHLGQAFITYYRPEMLPELFNFRGNITAWVKQLEKSATQPPMNVQEYISLISNMLLQTAKEYDLIKSDSAANKVLSAVTFMIKIFNERIKDIQAGGISLNSIFKNETNIKKLLESAMKLDPEMLEVLLNSSINPQLITKMILGQPIEYCNDTVKDMVVLPAGHESKAQEIYKIICSMNTTSIADELVKSLDLQEVVKELYRWMSNEPYNKGLNLSESTEEIEEFSRLLSQLINNPPNADPGLQQSMNVTALLNMLQTLLTNSWQEQIMRFINQFGPALESPSLKMFLQSVYENLHILNAELTGFRDGGNTVSTLFRNSSTFGEFYSNMMKHADLLGDQMTAKLHLIPYLAQLGKDPAVQAAVCDPDTFIAVFSDRQYINVTSISHVMCNNPSGLWYKHLTEQLGLTLIDVRIIINQLIPIYMKANSGKRPKVDLPPVGNWTLVSQEMKLFMDLLKQLNDIKENPTPQQWTTFLMGLLDGTNKASYDMTYNMMKRMDALMQADPSWQLMKKNLYAVAVGLQYGNKMMQQAKFQGPTVKLEDIFIDPDAVRDILALSMDPSSSSEFMVASVNPAVFMDLIIKEELEGVACNYTAFIHVFRFPNYNNTIKIQKDFCQAVKNNSLILKKMLDYWDLKDFNNKLFQSLAPGFQPEVDPMKLFLTQMEKFINNLVLLQGKNFTSDGSEVWMKQLADVFGSINNFNPKDTSAVCGGLEPVLQQADMGVITAINQILSSLSMTADSITKLPDVRNMFCEMPQLNLTELYKKMEDLGVFDAVKMISEQTSPQAQGSVSCRRIVQTSYDFSTVLNASLASMWPNMNSIFQCVANSSDKPMPALQQFDGMLEIIYEALSLLETMPDLKALQQQNSIFNMVLKGIIKQKPVVIKLASLFRNTSDITKILGTYAELSQELTYSLLEATVNINLDMVLNMTDSEIADILCDPDKLADIVQLPPTFPIDYVNISKTLCGANINETIQQIRDSINAGQILYQISQQTPEYFVDVDWYEKFAKDIGELVENMGSLMKITDMFQTLDISELASLLPQIQQFLVDNKPDEIFDNLIEIIEDFKAVIVDEQGQQILDKIKIIANGVRKLNIIKNYIPLDVNIRDILKNPDELLEYMTETLKMNPTIAGQFLNSSYSFAQLVDINYEEFKNTFCDPDKLGQYLTLSNTSTASVEDISAELCNLTNEAMIVNISQAFINQLDIGEFLKTYFTLDMGAFFSSTNMSLNETQEILQRFKPYSSSLNGVAKSLQKLTADLKKNTSDPLSAQLTSSDEMMQQFAMMMCNSDKPMSLNDQFQLSSRPSLALNSPLEEDPLGGPGPTEAPEVYTGEWTEKQQQEMKEIDYPYCLDLYKKINRAENGRIVWTYLKPLLYGKVLYSPNTAAVQSIMTEANWFFNSFESVERLAHAWTEQSGAFADMANSTQDIDTIMDAMDNPLVAIIMEDTVGLNKDDLRYQVEALRSLKGSNIDTANDMAAMVYNMSKCVEKRRMRGFETEEEMEKMAEKLQETNNLLAGVVFLSNDDKKTSSFRRKRAIGNELDKHVQYKIRMDSDNVPTTSRKKDQVWVPGADDNFAMDMRYMRGFLQIQDMIDNAIMKVQLNGTDPEMPDVSLQQMPYPCYVKDEFQQYISLYYFPIMMTLAWLVVVASAIRNLVYDKETGLHETMKIMGLSPGVNWIAWFLNTFLAQVIMSGVIVLILKLGNLMPYSNWLVLWVYLMCFSLSVTMMCYMVSAFFYKTTLAALTGVIVYMISYIPFIIIVSISKEMEFWQDTLASLFAPVAFGYASVVISISERRQLGVHWNSLDQTISTSTATFDWMLTMMIIDAVIYAILGWYIDNMIPGKYGISQPWYFPFSPKYWGCGKSKKESKYIISTNGERRYKDHNNSGIFGQSFKTLDSYQNIVEQSLGPGEAEPMNLPVGMSVNNLTKKYKKGNQMAVEDLNMTFYRGHISSLLGQNGAGKTTTINVLTGFLEPSSGAAYINGRNIASETRTIRKTMGMCPQHDVLFDYLTVKEHMEFFAKLKGKLSSGERKMDVQRMLDLTGLHESMHLKAKHLSGGQRRRLCIALAFIGGSEVIILDEPTSGVDPSARRHIWDLIMQNRDGRTILLTTHHLDEADVLSDRVFLLHQGHLVTSGSPMFLKSEYGSGYQLTLAKNRSLLKGTIEDEPIGGDVVHFVKQRLPAAYVAEEVGSEITMILPTEHIARFPQLFTDLEVNQQHLGVDSYGLSDTTMEEVFLKLTRQAETGKPLDKEKIKRWSYMSENSDSGISSGSSNNGPRLVKTDSIKSTGRSSGIGLIARQFGALWLKRFHHNRRDLKGYLFQIILPCLFILLAMGCTLIRPPTDHMPELALTPSIYTTAERSKLFYRNEGQVDLNDKLVKTFLKPPYIGTACMSGSPQISKCSNATWQHIAGQKSTTQLETCNCNGNDDGEQCRGPVPEHWKSNTSTYLYNLSGWISTTQEYLLRNHITYVDLMYGGWTFDKDDNKSTATVWYNNKGWHSMPAYTSALNNMILKANVHDKGGQTLHYGITTYSHPLKLSGKQLSTSTLIQKLADSGIALTILCAFCFIPAWYIIYLVNERRRKEKTLQHVYGAGGILYWVTAFIWDLMTYSFTTGLALAITAAFGISAYVARLNLAAFAAILLLYGWAIIPLMYLFSRVFKEATTGYMVTFLVSLLIGINTVACVLLVSIFEFLGHIGPVWVATEGAYLPLSSLMRFVFMIFPQFCMGDAIIQLTRNQLFAEVLSRFDYDAYVNPFTVEVGNIGVCGWHLVAMACQGFFFFILTLILEVCGCTCCRPRHVSPPDHMEDDDVSRERQTVVSGETRGDVLVVHNLSKVFRRGFRKVAAVDNIAFSVPKGECFGLLGVNGAGKTTTFNMLTGEVKPTSGYACMNGRRITDHISKMDRQVGYCPQEEALDGYLTGEEMLYCYGRVKGIPSNQLERICTNVINRVGLQNYAYKMVKGFSGGNKRKLSTALALMGDPELLLLDEPTSGMDPASRRLIWNNILEVLKDNRSVLFTSHSMAESEALCTKMAIMVNGRLTCIGPCQHLKNKFGRGYTLTIRIGSEQTRPDPDRIIDFVTNSFGGSILKDQHLNIMEFEIPAQSSDLSKIFTILQREGTARGIAQYSVAQTTLDQVFVDFAKLQGDGVDVEKTEATRYPGVKDGQGFYNLSYESSPPPTTRPGHPDMKKSLDSLNTSRSDESLGVHSFPTRGIGANVAKSPQPLSQESLHEDPVNGELAVSTFKPPGSESPKHRPILVTNGKPKSSSTARPLTQSNGRPVSDSSVGSSVNIRPLKLRPQSGQHDKPFDLRPGAPQEDVVQLSPKVTKPRKRRSVTKSPPVHRSTINVSPDSTMSHKSVINVKDDGSSELDRSYDSDREGRHKTLLSVNTEQGTLDGGPSSPAGSDQEGSHKTIVSVNDDTDIILTNMGPVEFTKL